jgi:hypothetical protein
MKNERKTSSGLLAIFGVAIGILLLLTVVLVFVFSGKGTLPLLSPDTPEGTVQGYLLAIEDGDYLSAYNYLSSSMNLLSHPTINGKALSMYRLIIRLTK